MRIKNPKHKLDQTVTLLKRVTYQFISSGNQKAGGVFQCWFCPSLLLKCTLLGSSPAEKGGWNEKVLEMMNRIEEKEDITSSPAWSALGFTTLLQISPSTESHWCHDIVFKYKTTSPCSLVHSCPHFLTSTGSPSSPFPLQPWVSATGASKYARLFRELVIFSWNWPEHNGEGCQILCTPFQACISRNRSLWLPFPDLSSATFLFLGQDERRLRMEQIRLRQKD